ncbi:MAG: phenylalanine--tRNA ligase subunit beta, partial [Pyrinomonadaceae bacterium]
VLLEVAYFDRESIRQTSRKLKLSTEASHRFERGVDIENIVRASNRATELICKLAGGEAGEFVDVYPTKFVQKEIQSNDLQTAVKRLTGLEIENEEIFRILEALGINEKNPEFKTRNSKLFIAPTWRHDLAIEEDLVEEVARVYGYDKIGEQLPPAFGAGEYQPNELRKFRLRYTLANLGFDEAISYSFIDTKYDENYEIIPNFVSENLDEKYISLRDSIIDGATRLRPTLLIGLLDAVRANLNQRQRNIRLFEIGKVFAASNVENDLPVERELFSVVLTGNETFQNKAMATRELDFYDAKGALESAAEALNISPLEFLPAENKHLRKGQSASVLYKNKYVGSVGRLADDIAQNYKFKQPVFVAEIDLQTILQSGVQEVFYRPLPSLPSVQRDVSLIVKRDKNFAQIKSFIESQNFELLRNIAFVDVFEGKGMSDNERSLTIRFEYRSDERTLLEEEVDLIHSRILNEVSNNFGAKQRA